MGHVYILVNSSMPGLVKIGKTKGSVNQRAKELHTTGVPMPFKVAFELASDEFEKLENKIHKELVDYRVNQQREFFRFPVDGAVEVIEALHSREPTSRISVLKALHDGNVSTDERLFKYLEKELKDPNTKDEASSILFSYVEKYQQSFDSVVQLLIYILDSGNWSDKSYKMQKAVTWLRRINSSDVMTAIHRYEKRIAPQNTNGQTNENWLKIMIVDLVTWLRSKIQKLL